MRAASLLRLAAAVAFAASLLSGAFAYLSFRQALATKIDRVTEIEHQAARPAAAARLAFALLERRLAAVSEPASQSIAAAFQRSDASAAIAEYRAAGGDSSLAAEAEKAVATEKPPQPQAEIALMRAVRGLRAEAAGAPRVSRAQPPVSASRAGRGLLAAAGAAAAALIFAHLSGRRETRPQ